MILLAWARLVQTGGQRCGLRRDRPPNRQGECRRECFIGVGTMFTDVAELRVDRACRSATVGDASDQNGGGDGIAVSAAD